MFKCVQASFAEHSMEMDHLYISFGLNENLLVKTKISFGYNENLLVIMKISFGYNENFLV